MRRENPDRVTPIVISRATILALVGLAAAYGIDLNVSNEQAGAIADILTAAVPLAFTLGGVLWGAKGAKARVTPIQLSPDDMVTPRNIAGRDLAPVDHRDPAAGYPPTRAVRPEDRGLSGP